MLYEKCTKIEQDLKGARLQASTVAKLEDDRKQLRRIFCEHEIGESAESMKPVKESATATEVCAEQLSADTVVAGVTLAEETSEDGEPWHDPDTGHIWARSDLSKNVERVGTSPARLSGTR